ncbi:MAG: hypothetical protein KGL53_14270, partial [Elusimicrobia bacterium]|nr:hypothetical protein [Elusimicrobiota bacterium]
MRGMMRRYAKPLAVALLFLDLSGARVIHVTDALAGNRSFFTAELGVKGFLAAATNKRWRHRGRRDGPAWSRRQLSAKDMERAGNAGPVLAAPLLAFAGAVAAPPAA